MGTIQEILSVFSPMSFKFDTKSLIAKAWNWYIGGFRRTPDLPLYRSPRFIRLALTVFFLSIVANALAPEGISTTATSSAILSPSESDQSYILTESEAYQKCRNHFANLLDLPSNSPIYTLDDSLSSLVVDEGNTNGGRVTQLGNGLTVVAGHALIERDGLDIKTRHFTCGLNTSDGTFSYLTKGSDNTWQ